MQIIEKTSHPHYLTAVKINLLTTITTNWKLESKLYIAFIQSTALFGTKQNSLDLCKDLDVSAKNVEIKCRFLSSRTDSSNSVSTRKYLGAVKNNKLNLQIYYRFLSSYAIPCTLGEVK